MLARVEAQAVSKLAASRWWALAGMLNLADPKKVLVREVFQVHFHILVQLYRIAWR